MIWLIVLSVALYVGTAIALAAFLNADFLFCVGWPFTGLACAAIFALAVIVAPLVLVFAAVGYWRAWKAASHNNRPG